MRTAGSRSLLQDFTVTASITQLYYTSNRQAPYLCTELVYFRTTIIFAQSKNQGYLSCLDLRQVSTKFYGISEAAQQFYHNKGMSVHLGNPP